MNSIVSRWIISTCAIFVLILSIDIAAGMGVVETLSYGNASTDTKATSGLRGSRILSGSTITTPNCSAIRTAQYPAELQLFYVYSVEINDSLLLSDMERAIDNAVAIELDMCDLHGRPVYKIRTSTTHSFSSSGTCLNAIQTWLFLLSKPYVLNNLSVSFQSTGTCDPIVPGNTCIIVNGETAVLLDENSDATFVRNKVYIGIAHGLGDPDFLNGFTNSVVSAALLLEGHASLVENSDHYHEKMDDSNESSYRSGITTTVAVAAASVTIVVASIFCYGFIRRPNSHDPIARHRSRSLRKLGPLTIVSGSQLGAPTRRNHFVRLEDLSASPTSFVTTSISPQSYSNTYIKKDVQECLSEYSEEEYHHEVNFNPTVNWSISDITTDSASLRSGVSRTPSMLERIDEEIESQEQHVAEGDVDNSSCNFSYSEDSTIITKALSKTGIVSDDDCSEGDGDDDFYRNPTHKNIVDFDCASERQDRILDISDLDPCFTILPDTTEDLFCDLDDFSSEGSLDSPLESIVLEMRMSTEDSDSDSFKTAVSDATLISLLPLHDFPYLDIIQKDSYRNLYEHINNEQSDGSILKRTLSTVKGNLISNIPNTSSQPEKKEESASLFTTIDEMPAHLTDFSEQTEVGMDTTVIVSISKSSVEAGPAPRFDDIFSVTDSSEEISASEVASEMDDSLAPSDDGSSTSWSSYGSEAKPTSPSLEGNESSNADTEVKKDAPENQIIIDSVSRYSVHADETKCANNARVGIGDDIGSSLHATDSIDEWVSELMNQKPNIEFESTLTKT
jgi:hypothetical protein